MISHSELVKSLFKPGREIVAQINPVEADLIHAIMGVSGETGELLDAIKKSVIYKKPLDVQHVIEELGDIEFYLEALRQTLSISREQTLEQNISKLQKRYPGNSYSNQDAIARADKNE
jgi:NTP pyrophosphatase (non-canonical NTP hydrolase)